MSCSQISPWIPATRAISLILAATTSGRTMIPRWTSLLAQNSFPSREILIQPFTTFAHKIEGLKGLCIVVLALICPWSRRWLGDCRRQRRFGSCWYRAFCWSTITAATSLLTNKIRSCAFHTKYMLDDGVVRLAQPVASHWDHQWRYPKCCSHIIFAVLKYI